MAPSLPKISTDIKPEAGFSEEEKIPPAVIATPHK